MAVLSDKTIDTRGVRFLNFLNPATSFMQSL